MSKTLVLALFLGSLSPADAKIRSIAEQNFNQGPVVETTHERKVREHLVTRCSHPSVGSSEFTSTSTPHVQAYDNDNCQNLCVFKDDQNQWCFSTTSPMLTTGWNWSQYTGTDFWQLLFKPYMTT